MRPAGAPVAGSARQRRSVPRPAGGNLEGRFGPFPGCLPCAGCAWHPGLWGRPPRSQTCGLAGWRSALAHRAAGRAAEARLPESHRFASAAGLARALSLTGVSQHCVIPGCRAGLGGFACRGGGRVDQEVVRAKTAVLTLQGASKSPAELAGTPCRPRWPQSLCFGRAEVGQGICVSNRCSGGFKVTGTKL